MAGIDSRVVEMSMRSAGFIGAATAVLTALQKLKDGLNTLKGSGKTLDEIDAAGKKVDLSSLSQGVDTISSRFSALGIVAMSALATIASRAVMVGAQLVKSMTIAPVAAGLEIYSTKLNAMQTILANTMGQAGSNIKDVTAALDELNQYANQTIYRFGDMAHNIGLFTAAGVDIQTSVASIKGLANLAALSGSSAQQAASAMYQLSQAIASGTIRLMDWNSVVNAGMGGKVFQNILIETARANGIAVDAMIKKWGSFRDSLQSGWLTSKVMTQALSLMTGDLTKEQIMAMGFTEKETLAIMKQAKAAVAAATKIKTVSQLQEVMADSIATAWAKVWEAILGNLPQATKLLTGIAAGLSKIFVAPIQNLGKLLAEWNKIGGRDLLIDALTRAFQLLGDVMKPIGKAFRDIFPATTATQLLALTQRFYDFIIGLKLSGEAAKNLHNTFEGLFSVIKIVWEVIKGVAGVIGKLIGTAIGASGGFLSLTGRIGEFLTHLKDSIVSGKAFAKFFQFLGTILSAPVKLIGLIGQGLAALAEGFSKALDAMKPFFDWIRNAFSKIGQVISDAISSGDFSNVLNVLNQVLLGGLLLTIRKFVKNLGIKIGGIGKFGILDTIKSAFGGLTDALKAMQTSIQAGTIQKIAIAVGILAAAIVALSFIDPGRLTKSLTAITVMFSELLGAMTVVIKISTSAGIVKMGVVAAALNLLASSIVILSGAVAILSRFSWEELAKGLGAVAVMLGELVGAVKLMSGSAKGLIASAIAMNLMAIALNALALAVKILGGMDVTSLIKGVAAIGALLLIVGLFNKFGGTGLIATAAAMLILGAALNVMAAAMKILGGMSWGEIARSLVELAGALLIIVAAMKIMPEMGATALGLLIVAAALTIMAKALTTMGKMSWGEIARSLVELAGALLLLSAAMIVMTYGMLGAEALFVVAAALAILTPQLVTLGKLSWGEILKSLVALAGAFLIIGAAGLLLGPLVPVLIGLGAAIALLGIGMLAIGAGVFLLGTGLAALGAALAISGAAILGFVKGLLSLIPYAIQKIGEGIINFIKIIANSGTAITKAFVTILTAILNGIIKVMPLIGKAIKAILDLFLKIIVEYIPKAAKAFARILLAILNTISNNMTQFVNKGAEILVKFLQGIANNIGRVAAAGTNIVIAFIKAVGSNASRVIEAAARMVIDFVNKLADQIRSMAPQLGKAAGNLGAAIIQGIISGIGAMAQELWNKLGEIASGILSKIGGFLGFGSPAKELIPIGMAVVEGLAVGMDKNIPEIDAAAQRTGNVLLNALNEAARKASGELEGMNIHPVITPVIDLSEAKRGFDDMAAMYRSSLRPVASFSAANSISAMRNIAPPAGQVTPAGGTSLSFTQYNTSPKALSAADIYRQTNNQLSAARNQLTSVRGALP